MSLRREPWEPPSCARSVAEARRSGLDRSRAAGRGSTWSAVRTVSSPTRPAIGAVDDVLHLHRLERHDRIAGLDGLPRTRRGPPATAPGIGAVTSMGRSPPAMARRRPARLGRRRAAAPAGTRRSVRRRSTWTSPSASDLRRRRGHRTVGRTAVELDRALLAVALAVEPSGGAFSRQPPAHGSAAVVSGASPSSARAAATQASSGTAVRSDQSSGGQIRSRVSVRAWPVEDDRLADQPAQEPQVRDEPEDDRLVERAGEPLEGLVAGPGRGRSILASIGSKRPPTSLPRSIPASTRIPSPGRPPQRLDPPGRRQEAGLGVLGVEPRPRPRAPADFDGLAWYIRAARPSAIRSWSATRSRPVTSSVTGCSTWRRVFISRKVNAPRSSSEELAGPGAHVARPRARGSARPSPSPARSSGPTAGDGVSSRTFWCRRWIEQSRSPRWTP